MSRSTRLIVVAAAVLVGTLSLASPTWAATARGATTASGRTTYAAPGVAPTRRAWRSSAVNVDAIRATAVAALAARGTLGEATARAALAAAVSVAAPSAPASVLFSAWSRLDSGRMLVVYTALAQVGTPYRSLGGAPGGFDCSGLTSYAWRAAGVELPRSSWGQRAGLATVDGVGGAHAGDIIWYPGHVELYLGAGRAMVHAKRPGDVVQVEDARRIVAVKRPV